MHLTVVKIRNGKSQPGVFHKSLNRLMSIQVRGGRLLPLSGIGNNVVQMAFHHFPHITTGPKIHVGGGPWAARGFVAGDFRGFTLRSVGTDGLQQAFDDPTVIRRKKNVFFVRGRVSRDLAVEVTVNNRGQLRKEPMSRNDALTLSHVIPRQCAGKVKNQFLRSVFGPELGKRDVADFTRPTQGRSSLIVDVQPLHFNLRGNAARFQHLGSHLFPVHGHAMTNGLRVSFDARKGDGIP